MIELIDFSKCPSSMFGYGGMSGKKLHISFNKADYMLKFPDNLATRNLKNVALSYSNGPVCEYLGSHVYQLLDIPVHETLLGKMNGKLVVACKHIYEPGQYLSSFADMRNSAIIDTTTSSGTSVVLSDVLRSLNSLSTTIPGIEERFWDMFVVDAFINNPDRNNGNWGIIHEHINGIMQPVSIAPVFDNAASFNPRWDDAKFTMCLNDRNELESMSHKAIVSIFKKENGNHINPFQFMESHVSEACDEAIERITPKIDLAKINNLIEEVLEMGLITEPQANFYSKALELRLNDRLIPICEEIQSASPGY